MERKPEAQYDFNEPLLERVLGSGAFSQGEVVVAMAFLQPVLAAAPRMQHTSFALLTVPSPLAPARAGTLAWEGMLTVSSLTRARTLRDWRCTQRHCSPAIRLCTMSSAIGCVLLSRHLPSASSCRPFVRWGNTVDSAVVTVDLSICTLNTVAG